MVKHMITASMKSGTCQHLLIVCLSANKLKSDGNWRFSGTKGDMNEYFVNEKHKNVWLVCEYVDGLNYPLWKMHLAPDFKFIDPTPLKAKANIAEMESFTLLASL
jgi:hypothetical protein